MGRGGSGLKRGGGISDIGRGVKIGDERFMYSERPNAQMAVEDTIRVEQNVVDEYGDEFKAMNLMLSDVSDGVLGYYRRDSKIIALSDKYMDRDVMNATYDAGVKDGFHPSRGSKSGVEAVMSHEYGHAVHDKVAQRMGMSMEDSAARIVTEARANLKGKNGQPVHSNVKQMASAISGYAATKYTETIAEAFADVYCNGGKAKKESQAIVSTMKSYIVGGN